MEYEINSNTLAIIPYQKGKSKILELNDEYIVNLTPYQVIENSCSYYGSSLNGRMNGARSILGSVYKIPVMVEETNNLIFFPTTAIENEKNVWIGSNNILNYHKKGKNTVDIRHFSMINLVEKSRVHSVILKPNVENRRGNGRVEAGENEGLCRDKVNIR